MKLSVIIVNYNVKYFLEQCLQSVQKATKNIDAEIFVVDNSSVDGSCAMMHEKFQDITLIENDKNLGFSKANNQAIRLSKGEYIMLLNPDTVVEENTFEKVLHFADNHPDAGGIGIKMIDGSGNFLPESKRGLPTPLVAFYKIFGLSKLFPRSKTFAKYHLGYLDNDKTHKIDVLAGAFMFLRKSVLDQIGLLDEEYFMYGEDIDLSYRIIKAGYNNYYFPDTTIIHYKGESTKKGSINYVLVFYNAMIIFARKHFSRKNAAIYSFLIKSAVYFRAVLSIFKRFFTSIFLPFLDAITIYAGYYFLVPYWESYKFPDGSKYPEQYLKLAVPVYVTIWLFSIIFSNGYQKSIKILKILRGISIGTIVILLLYSLLPEHFRFSRALILIGTIWAYFITIVTRLILHYTNIQGFKLSSTKKKRIVIVGSEKEAERVNELLANSGVIVNFSGLVNPEINVHNDNFLGNISQLNEVIKIHKIDEIIFCSKDLTAQKIIRTMLKFNEIKVGFKIAPKESISIIGSDSINAAGELYIIIVNNINSLKNRIYKRLTDLSFGCLILLFSPLVYFFQDSKNNFFNTLFSILSGKKSWVGYTMSNELLTEDLPQIKPCVFNTRDMAKANNISISDINKLNTLYAKNYRLIIDFKTILFNLNKIGNKAYLAT